MHGGYKPESGRQVHGATQGRIAFPLRFRLQFAVSILKLQPTLKIYSNLKPCMSLSLHVFIGQTKYFQCWHVVCLINTGIVN